MTTYIRATIPATELRIGDVVKVFDDEWGTAIVKNIAAGLVHFFRPYGHADNFIYSGGVICYTGVEEFTRPHTVTEMVYVYRREEGLR